MPSTRKHRTSKAFTLVELLTVIAIIGILAGVLVPIIGTAIDKAVNAKSLANLREIGKASILYSQRYKGKALPAEADVDFDGKNENWWQIITHMTEGSKALASAKNQTQGLRPFEDPKWPDDPEYSNKEIGIALNSSPGLPDVNTRNAEGSQSNAREFRLSQIDLQGQRILACIWDDLEISKGNASRGSFNRTVSRYGDHINVVYFDSHAAQYDSGEYEKFSNAINDPTKNNR